MDENNHIVSGIYTSRSEAEAVRDRLLSRGLPQAQTNVWTTSRLPATPGWWWTTLPLRMCWSMAASASLLVRAWVLCCKWRWWQQISVFIASSLIAPLAMLGWGAALGGVVGAVIGAEKAEDRTDGKFSDLVLDAIRSGHVVLIAHTRSVAETALVREVIGDSVLLRS